MNKYEERKIKTVKDIYSDLSDEAKQSLEDHVLGVMQTSVVKKQQEFKLASMTEYTKEAKVIAEHWGQMQGLSSGYRSLDRLTKGFVGGEVTVVAAKTSVGKTALAINIANNISLKDVPVLFVTLEMTKAQLTSRYLYINGGETEDYEKVASLTVFQETDELNWKSIDGLIGNFCKEFTNSFVVIDHLHYFTRELENVSEDLGRITKELKKNAIRHNVPIVLISHVRKGPKDISIEDLRGSSYVGQDADIVLICGRSEDGTKLGIKVEKNRNRGFDYLENEIELEYDKTKITEKSNDPFDE